MEQPTAHGRGNMPDASGAANPGTFRGTAICAGLGGLFLVAYSIVMALKPAGVVSYLEAGPPLMFAALGLIIATAVGLLRMHRFDGGGARVVRIATLIAAASWLIAVLGVVVTAVFLRGDSSLVYFLAVLPGLLLGMLAFAVTGAGLMRSRVLPAWSGALLVLTSLLLFGFNTEDERILFAIPFGLTWMVLGGLLLSAAPPPGTKRRARIQHA